MRPSASLRHCAPDARALVSRRRCDLRASKLFSSHASVLLMDVSRFSLCLGRVLPVLLSPLKNLAKVANQPQRVSLSRVRLQLPVWLNEHRASLHECAQSLLLRIRPLACSQLSLLVCPFELAPMSLFPAFRPPPDLTWYATKILSDQKARSIPPNSCGHKRSGHNLAKGLNHHRVKLFACTTLQ